MKMTIVNVIYFCSTHICLPLITFQLILIKDVIVAVSGTMLLDLLSVLNVPAMS